MKIWFNLCWLDRVKGLKDEKDGTFKFGEGGGGTVVSYVGVETYMLKEKAY